MVNLSIFDDVIAAKSVLHHPFYVRWSKGELTLEDLKIYAKEYFHLVSRIPGVVERVRDRAVDRTLRARIEQNVVEEQEHVELWKRFAKSVGVTEAELEAYEPTETVKSAVNRLEKLAEGTLDEGMAAVYALERELPAIAQTKKEGLSKWYGLTSEDAHIYFDEHLGEEKHLEVWRSLPVPEFSARTAVQESLRVQNAVLDGVCERCGIPLSC